MLLLVVFYDSLVVLLRVKLCVCHVVTGLVKEEETQRMKHEHERAMERCKSECEREKHSLQKQHSHELENTIEKTNNKLTNIGQYL